MPAGPPARWPGPLAGPGLTGCVLHVTRLTDRGGQYYLADLARELGPAREAGGVALVPGPPGRWTGDGATGLGLAGGVDAADLGAVLEGRAPSGTRPLVRRRGTVAGFDLTFTAPKSASVLFAVAPPGVAGEVVAAHAEAVEAAMGYVERRAVAVRRGAGEDRALERVDGVAAAAFTHGVSRALDPHLHTHVVVANMGHGPDGRWTAVDGRGLYAHAIAAGHLYEAHLRHGLAGRLGVGWRAAAGGRHEVEGIGPDVVGTFSSRRAEILGHLAERVPPRTASPAGRPSARAARVAWAATRDPKDPGLDPAALAGRWAARAADCGLDVEGLATALGRRPWRVAVVDEHRFGALLAQAPPAGVARRDVVAAWAGALVDGSPAGSVEQCCDRLAAWGDAPGVGEHRRAPADAAPPRHLLTALGPRPASPALLGVWLDAADRVGAYRARWGVTDRDLPLGLEPSGPRLAGLGAHRLADHLAAARVVANARRTLGLDRAAPRYLGLGGGIEDRQPGLGRDAHERDAGLGLGR